MATDAGVTNFYKYASSIYFSGRCPFELLSERCRLDLEGKNFFLLASGATVWLGSVPREFFFLLLEQYRFASIKSNLSL